MSPGRRRRLAFLAAALAPAVWLACGIDVVGVDPSANRTADDAGAAADDGATPTSDGGGAVDGARGDGSDGGSDGGAFRCPTGSGPALVDIGGTCVDATEVTEAQYAAFLDAGTAHLSPACAWKRSFVPGVGGADCRWDPSKKPNLPVVCVDWCDAESYCQWAGKRLCGAIGGGPVPWSGLSYKDPAIDQWYRACSKAGTQRYPYGTTRQFGACNVKDGGGVNEVVDAGAAPACVGGYPGIYDMVGNAYEHEDSCDDANIAAADAGARRDDLCRLRGGSWFHDDTDSNCEAFGAFNHRDDRFDDLGFRCCAP